MSKEEILRELSAKVATGEISREEVMGRLNISPEPAAAATKSSSGLASGIASHFSITKILYVLGAVIVLIGIVIFIGQIWVDMGSFNRILVTLGMGLLVTAIGSVLANQRPGQAIGPVFHFIGGLLVPGGAMVALYEFSPEVVSLWPVAITFGAIFLFYLALVTAHRHFVLTFFALANGTAFVYLLVGAMFSELLYLNEDLYAYLTMAVGISYLLLAQSFRGGWNSWLAGILCLAGSAGFLGAAFTQVLDSVPWQLFYFPLLLGGFLLSVYIKSRSVLAMSTLFLIVHVSYITNEYFADSLGWPISLVILGFLFIGLGYASISINKRYIKGAA